jgi:hypothetical protein
MLDTLAKVMWSQDLPYEPTPFEQTFLRDHDGPQWPGNRYWESFRDELPLEGIYPLVSDFRDKTCRATVAALLGHVLSRVDRIELDWLYIGYRRLYNLCVLNGGKEPLPALDPSEKRFVASGKLWEFMKETKQPRETVGQLIERTASKLAPLIGRIRPADRGRHEIGWDLINCVPSQLIEREISVTFYV